MLARRSLREVGFWIVPTRSCLEGIVAARELPKREAVIEYQGDWVPTYKCSSSIIVWGEAEGTASRMLSNATVQ